MPPCDPFWSLKSRGSTVPTSCFQITFQPHHGHRKATTQPAKFSHHLTVLHRLADVIGRFFRSAIGTKNDLRPVKATSSHPARKTLSYWCYELVSQSISYPLQLLNTVWASQLQSLTVDSQVSPYNTNPVLKAKTHLIVIKGKIARNIPPTIYEDTTISIFNFAA